MSLRLAKMNMQRALLAFIYCKGQGLSMNDISRYASRNWLPYVQALPKGSVGAPSKKAIDIVVDVINEGLYLGGGNGITFDLSAIMEQLTQKSVHDSTLIDRIADILKREHSKSVLSGKTLDLLRKAVLLPDEAAGLVERLARKENACEACGHTFTDGEIVTFRRTTNGPRTGSPSLFCSTCSKPTSISCDAPDCHGHAILPAALTKTFRKTWLCAEHLEIERLKKTGAPIPPAPLAGEPALFNDAPDPLDLNMPIARTGAGTNAGPRRTGPQVVREWMTNHPPMPTRPPQPAVTLEGMTTTNGLADTVLQTNGAEYYMGINRNPPMPEMRIDEQGRAVPVRAQEDPNPFRRGPDTLRVPTGQPVATPEQEQLRAHLARVERDIMERVTLRDLDLVRGLAGPDPVPMPTEQVMNDGTLAFGLADLADGGGNDGPDTPRTE